MSPRNSENKVSKQYRYPDMIVDHIVASVENPSSGVTQSVCGLCNGLAKAGVEVTLHSLIGCHPEVTAKWRNEDVSRLIGSGGTIGYKHLTYPCSKIPFPEFGRSPSMVRALRWHVESSDVFHNHCLWMLTNIYPYWVLKGRKKPFLVTSPHGTLTEHSLSRSRWKKRIMWMIGQRALLERTDMFHVTSMEEYECVRRLGFKQPVMLVKLGIDVPETIHHSENDGQERTLMYLSRIHPDKRLDLLLSVWKELEERFPDWKLDVYGSLDGEYPKRMMGYVRTLGLNSVSFKGEILGRAKMAAYASADLFVLPTHTENFGLVVAEALACGTPAIVTKGAPWKRLEEKRCGWWVDETAEGLRDSLALAMALTVQERAEMGLRGREWMKKEFGWAALSQKMAEAYAWGIGKGSRPDCVIIE